MLADPVADRVSGELTVNVDAVDRAMRKADGGLSGDKMWSIVDFVSDRLLHHRKATS